VNQRLDWLPRAWMPVKNVGVPVSKSQKVWLASFCLHKSPPHSSLLPSSPVHLILFLIIAADLESLKPHYWYVCCVPSSSHSFTTPFSGYLHISAIFYIDNASANSHDAVKQFLPALLSWRPKLSSQLRVDKSNFVLSLGDAQQPETPRLERLHGYLCHATR